MLGIDTASPREGRHQSGASEHGADPRVAIKSAGTKPPLVYVYGIIFILLQHRSETLVEFEFDEAKSRANKSKHDIDFVEAQALWLDESFVEVPARTEDELRFLVVGMISDKHWSAVITYRGERVRLISVRRSRVEEVEIYES
jgi:uncharacterized DUF497 family protein